MNTWTLVLLLVSSLLNAAGSVLAWFAKLRWSKEFATAKDEVIKAKEAQIEMLKAQIVLLGEMNPMKVREYFTSTTTQLEEYIEKLQHDLQEARAELEAQEKTIRTLSGGSHANELGATLERNIETLEKTVLLDKFSRYLLYQIREPKDKDRIEPASRGKTGEICSTSGIYRCVQHRENEIPMARGQRFPPCSLGGGHAADWEVT